jgi:NADP-reducing hydrogenase subunit HndC
VRALPHRRPHAAQPARPGSPKGNGRAQDLDKIREIGRAMQKASLCGLGQTAPEPGAVDPALLRGRVPAHIDDQRCPAGKCKDLVTY